MQPDFFFIQILYHKRGGFTSYRHGRVTIDPLIFRLYHLNHQFQNHGRSIYENAEVFPSKTYETALRHDKGGSQSFALKYLTDEILTVTDHISYRIPGHDHDN